MTTTKSDLVSAIFQFSDKIKDNRTEKDIMLSLQEEIGELALELKITNGLSYKEPSSDGVIGEAIDAINCLVDLIRIHNPNITSEEITNYATTKCTKWLEKSAMIKNDK